MLNSIINSNNKFKQLFLDKTYNLSSISILEYYNSDMASVTYSGEYTNKVRNGGFFYISKDLVKDFTGKTLLKEIENLGG